MKETARLTLIGLAIVLGLIGLSTTTTFADCPKTSNSSGCDTDLVRNGVDPNYKPTAAELKLIALKEAQARQAWDAFVRARSGGVKPYYPGFNLLDKGTYREPNDYAHRNYCGPGATQVILSVRIPASQIPGIETIASDENLDPNWGVYNTAVRDELNRLLNTGFYIYVTNYGQAQLKNAIYDDIDLGWALDTSLYTGGMPGWGTQDVKHIIAIYGYYAPDTNAFTVYYTETAQYGFTGYYTNNTSLSTFYGYVSAHSNGNNSQVW